MDAGGAQLPTHDDVLVAAIRQRAAEVGAPIRLLLSNWVPRRPVRLGLHGTHEDFAAELHGQYGNRIELSVGSFRYPFDHAAPALPAMPAPVTTRRELSAELAVVPDSQATSGALITGTVTVTNRHPSEPFDVVTAEWATGFLVRDGLVVSDDLWPDRDRGIVVALRPGEQKVLQFRCTTDGRNLAPGPRVLPGDYDLVVVVGASDLGGPRDQRLVSPPVPIHVLAP